MEPRSRRDRPRGQAAARLEIDPVLSFCLYSPPRSCSQPPPHHPQTINMARKFFVGGNWKLNPTSLSAALTLVEGLNQAALDPDVGMSADSLWRALTTAISRGCRRTAIVVSSSRTGEAD